MNKMILTAIDLKVATATVAVSLMMSLSALAGKGGEGGDTLKSTEAEVIKIIAGPQFDRRGNPEYYFKAFNYIVDILEKRTDGESFFQHKNPKIKEILQALKRDQFIGLYGSPSLRLPDETDGPSERGATIWLSRSPCQGEHGSRDASVKVTKFIDQWGRADKRADICLSIEGLRKFKGVDLQRQAIFLVLHEYAHVAGFNEQDATFFQEFMAEHLFEPCRIEFNGHYISILPSLDNRGFVSHPFDNLIIEVIRGEKCAYAKNGTGGGCFKTMEKLNTDDGYRFPFKFERNNSGSGILRFGALDESGQFEAHEATWLDEYVIDDEPAMIQSRQQGFSYNGKDWVGRVMFSGSCAY